jgi:hypothetical protein
VLGSNPDHDRTIEGHVREIFDFDSGNSLFKVEAAKTVFPFLTMKTTDGLPIEQSKRVIFAFSDPGGNFAGATIHIAIEESKWKVEAATGRAVLKDQDGWYRAPLGIELALVPVPEPVVAAREIP